MRTFIGVTSVAVAAFVLALPATSSDGAEAVEPAGASKPEAEIDLVVQTGVRFSPDHTRMVQDRLVALAGECLKGLVTDKSAEGAPLEDGATPYRLVIQHTAAIKVNKGTRRETFLQDRDFYSTFVTAQESGRYQFLLTKWTGSTYAKAGQWQVPYSEMHWFGLPKNATSRQSSELGQKMILQAQPASVKSALLSRLLPIGLAGSVGQVGQMQDCRVAVANRSPWTMKELEVVLRWPDARAPRRARYQAKFVLTQPLPPGKQRLVTCSGEPLDLDYAHEYTKQMEIYPRATWAPAEAN